MVRHIGRAGDVWCRCYQRDDECADELELLGRLSDKFGMEEWRYRSLKDGHEGKLWLPNVNYYLRRDAHQSAKLALADAVLKLGDDYANVLKVQPLSGFETRAVALLDAYRAATGEGR